MTLVHRDVLHAIGNTSLVPLRRIAPPNAARILLKLESENPTGSMKDRMALAMIEAAEADGRLKPAGTVVEYTGGSTGVSLSLVCTVRGYPLQIVTSDAFAAEKLDHMRLLGAQLHIVRSDGGRMTEKLTRDMVETARVIAAQTGGFWTDQLNNEDQIAAYHKLAEEIWHQTEGRIDGFVQSVGTAASLRGTAEGLRRHDTHLSKAAPAVVLSEAKDLLCRRFARMDLTETRAPSPVSCVSRAQQILRFAQDDSNVRLKPRRTIRRLTAARAPGPWSSIGRTIPSPARTVS